MVKEAYLLKNNLNERTITHKLAYCFEALSKEFGADFIWDIDVEYNRNNDEFINDINHAKRLCLYIERINSDDDKGTTVYPDIIFHRRGKNNREIDDRNNLLVIEIKKDTPYLEHSNDDRKIRAFLQTEPFRYCYGLFINFITGENPQYELTWYNIHSRKMIIEHVSSSGEITKTARAL